MKTAITVDSGNMGVRERTDLVLAFNPYSLVCEKTKLHREYS
jgi:hypothetical protein